VRIWMGVLLRPLPFSALSLSLARLQMDDMKWICGSNECFCCRSSSSWFRPPCFPLGFVVWSSGDEGCCGKAYQTANEYTEKVGEYPRDVFMCCLRQVWPVQ
jgi:hypothetical protein